MEGEIAKNTPYERTLWGLPMGGFDLALGDTPDLIPGTNLFVNQSGPCRSLRFAKCCPSIDWSGCHVEVRCFGDIDDIFWPPICCPRW